MFDGRVRNGNGSDHSFMATKLLLHGLAVLKKDQSETNRQFLENYTQGHDRDFTTRELKRYFPVKEKAIKPHDRLVLVS